MQGRWGMGRTYNVDVHAAANVVLRREGQAHPVVRAGKAAGLVVAREAHLNCFRRVPVVCGNASIVNQQINGVAVWPTNFQLPRSG